MTTTTDNAAALALLRTVINRAVPAGEDSTGQAMVKMRRAFIDEIAAFVAAAEAQAPRDYLAIFMMATGSSHGRAATIDDAVANCLEHCCDWASLFDIDGKPAKFGIYDVAGRNGLHWTAQGVFDDADPSQPLPLLETRDVTLYAKRKGSARKAGRVKRARA